MQEFSPPPPPQAPTPQMGNGQMYAGVPKKLSLKIRKKTNATLHNSYCARRTGKRFQKSFVKVSTWMGRNKERELVHDSLVNCQTR